MKIAKELAGQGLTFAVSQHNDFQHELEEYGRGFVSGDKPVVCARDAKNSKFVMEDDFSMDALKKFVEDFSVSGADWAGRSGSGVGGVATLGEVGRYAPYAVHTGRI